MKLINEYKNKMKMKVRIKMRTKMKIKMKYTKMVVYISYTSAL
jgi:hypothetical protein